MDISVIFLSSLAGAGVATLLFLTFRSRPSNEVEGAGSALFSAEVTSVRNQLSSVSEQIQRLRTERAQQTTAFNSAMEHVFDLNQRLSTTTERLSSALASPTTRGQWGERLAEDVLRAAGFVEGVSFHKQQRLANGNIPDFTFALPKNQQLAMDIKFPIDNYAKSLEAKSDFESAKYLKRFKVDVRKRVSELGDRGYIEPGRTLGYMLLFVPNESIYAAIHRADPDLIDFAMSKRIVLCSPMSLFAVLAVIRQGVDNYLLDVNSQELYVAIENLSSEWEQLQEPILKMGRGLESARRAYLDLTETSISRFDKVVEDLTNQETVSVGIESGSANP